MRLKMIFSVIAVMLCVIWALQLTSCNNEPDNTESSTGYEYIPSGQETTTASANNEAEAKINVDSTWKKNFKVKYSYYNPEQSLTTMKIQEKRAYNAFTVEYLDTSSILYYKANGNNTDYYVIIDSENEQVHSVLEGKHFSSLSSMFMKLSEVSPDLPSQSNVLYMYDESVAGRNCHKYIQRAYSDGKLTQSVYVWVDSQYGFVAKCEAYDASEILTVMWAIEEFEAGSLTDEDVMIDLDGYTFKEELG